MVSTMSIYRGRTIVLPLQIEEMHTTPDRGDTPEEDYTDYIKVKQEITSTSRDIRWSLTNTSTVTLNVQFTITDLPNKKIYDHMMKQVKSGSTEYTSYYPLTGDQSSGINVNYRLIIGKVTPI